MQTARAHFQAKLFEVPPVFRVRSAGDARVAFGRAAEEIVCAALGLNSIKIDGACAVNFDAEKDGVFYEIKSVKARSGKLIAYDWRLQKESAYPNLFYCVLIHNVSGVRENIIDEMLSRCQILILPASLVREAACRFPLNIPKKKVGQSKRFGYTREGYADGYRNIPIGHLLNSVRYRLEVNVDLYDYRRRVGLLIA